MATLRKFIVLQLLIVVTLLSLSRAEINNGDDEKLRKMIPRINISEAMMDHVRTINLRINSDSESGGPNSRIVRLRDILDVFDVETIADNWDEITNAEDALTKNCTHDVGRYIDGLKSRRIWAIKMDDASGHYTSGFFYGNNYWMGSLSLCESIYQKENETPEQVEMKVTWNTGLPFAKAHQQQYSTVRHENPPFQTGFFILKMILNETLTTPLVRTVYMGVCLPSSCTTEDVRMLSSISHTPLQYRQVELIDIRMPTAKRYNIFTDVTFLILVSVSGIVAVLMFFGTIYEICLQRRLQKVLQEQDKEMMSSTSETSSGIGCAASDYSDSGTNDIKKDINIVLNLPVASMNNNNSDEHLEGHLHEPEKLSIYSELLLSFSVITNFNAICDRNVGSDTIPSIHGLRAFSMAWVILGHTCIVVFKYSDNMEMRKDVEKNIFFQAITSAPFSVDTFFFLSGILVSYIYFRTNAKGNLNKLSNGVNEFTAGVLHFVGLVAYRFMRLTAPYMYVLGFVQVSMQYLETFSIFDPPTMDHITCPQYWWRNLLYINTLFPVDQMCMLWSWYLANDTQFYIVGAIILIVAVRHFKLAASTMALFLVSSWVTTAIIAFNNNHKPNTDDPLALFDKIYDKPWTRLGPYLVGMAVGWILFKTNCKIRLSKFVVGFGWTLAMTNLLVLVFGLYNTELSKVTAAAYSSLSHSAWALSLAWITIACSTGYGGLVNTILSAPCIYPFSRVTYCAYLVHPIVIRTVVLNSDAPLHLGVDSMIVTFFGLVVSSWLLSFIVSLSFEAPVVTMLKILTPNRKKRVTK